MNSSTWQIKDSDNQSIHLLKKIHLLSGHRGVSTTFNNLKSNLYIKNLIKISQINKRCKSINYRRDKGLIRQANDKMWKISTDIFEPFKYKNYSGQIVEEKSEYILRTTDVYTRFTKEP